MKKVKYLHRDDRAVMKNFIDYARLKKAENIDLEITARHLAVHLKVNPDQTNGRLASKFASLLESGKVK